MSSLLERMVQRARAPLPSVEPLAPARYAPVRTAGQQPWIESLDAADLPIGETQIFLSEPPATHSSLEPLHGEDMRPLPEIEISAPEERPTQREFFPTRQSSPEQAFRSFEIESSQKTHDTTRHIPEYREAASLMSLPQSETPMASGPAFTANSANKVSPLQSPNARVMHGEKNAHESAAATLPAQAARVNVPQRQNPPLLRRQNQSAAQVENGGENTISEVTISIGHIDIRAEQPAPRAKAPTFRPRVSLNDFLNQRNGKRL
jgi:hypothetical protein